MDLINGNEIAKIIIEELKTRVENFKDGKRHGLRQWYDNKGNLSYEVNYTNGKEEGLKKHFNEDGTLKKTETYKNGKLVE